MKSKHRTRTIRLVLFEGLLTYLCGGAAIWIRFGSPGEALEVLGDQAWAVKLLFVNLVVLGSFYLFDLYDFKMIRQRMILTLRILQSLSVSAITLALLFYLLPEMRLGRGVIALSLLLTLAMMLLWRFAAMWMLRNPRLAERVMILGTDANAVGVAREMLQHVEYGYEVVGFVGNDPALVGKSLINPSVIGLMDDLESLVRNHRPDRIIVAMAERDGKLPMHMLLKLKIRDEISIEEGSRFFERVSGRIYTDDLQPEQLVFSDAGSGVRIYKRLQRLFDIAAAVVGLVLSSPIMLITAIAIRLESKGPVFYLQERVGLHGEPFRIIKFRSMRTDAEANGPVWAGENDPRVTRVGRLIRKTRIDEIPQFINVLRGEMSLIGPRPERPQFVTQLEARIPYYSERHLVKPGLTGWAQVRYPYGASFEDAREKHQYDLYYIKNQSPLLDALIVLETIRVVLFGRLSR